MSQRRGSGCRSPRANGGFTDPKINHRVSVETLAVIDAAADRRKVARSIVLAEILDAWAEGEAARVHLEIESLALGSG